MASGENVLWVVTSTFTRTGTWVFRTRAAANKFKREKNATRAAHRRGLLGELYYVCRATWGPEQ